MAFHFAPGDHSHMDNHDEGLAADWRALVERRQVLRWALGAGLLPLLACDAASVSADGGSGGLGSGGTGTGTGGTSTGGSGTGGTTGACSQIPEETAGPYPGDGSNGPNVLTASGVVRSDIRSCFGGAVGTATGVPLTVTLNLVGASAACAPLAGYAVYLWHCDQSGLYSLYSAGVTDKNYLRGLQTANGNGSVSFTTIYPACYSGRWPHIHFEVYSSLDIAIVAGSRVATSQLALPAEICAAVFATSGYSASVANLRQISLATDNVFSDGASLQIPAVTGNVTDGYVATLTVPVAG
jgi:protocatechuate 3,4-dioxygenase beta subunit